MPEKYRINRGDILFSWSGNPDTSIDTYVWTNGPAWLNQHIFRVVPPSELERPYVLAMLKYLRPVFAEVARNKQTTGLGHVTVSDLKRLNCVKPPNSLLVRWHDLIVPILDRIFLSEVETQTLESHRDALLPKLLSGELRVPVTGEV
jgi:type I restriction enzyme S subunit